MAVTAMNTTSRLSKPAPLVIPESNIKPVAQPVKDTKESRIMASEPVSITRKTSATERMGRTMAKVIVPESQRRQYRPPTREESMAMVKAKSFGKMYSPIHSPVLLSPRCYASPTPMTPRS
mmetsp:Transcript_18295/g.31692  ORF Transcript_18295/g.31692 Transcript_18295/m.31692 type:complete len:121 (+) Transcript_18295:82-444(+)